MTPRLVLLAVVVLLGGCPAPQRPQPAGPLAMIEASADLDGRRIGSTDARATIVVLMASWCGHCRTQLASLETFRNRVRIVGVAYTGHEEYDNRGDATKLRAYVAGAVPWLRVVPAGEPLFDALGRPPFVPAVWVFDGSGTLVELFDRRNRPPPTRDEMNAVLTRLGA